MKSSYCWYITLGVALAAGCNTNDEPESTPTSPTAPPVINYLALGDSYTIGERVSQAESFPFQLRAALQTKGYNVAEPTVIARTGWRSDVLLSNIKPDNTGPAPDLITLLIGVNDQYQGRSVESFRQNLLLLLDEAERLAKGGRGGIVLVTIPDYSATPFAAGSDTVEIRTQLDAFDATVLAEAAARGLPVVDITPGSKDARADRTLVADDGLHPSGRMYARWVEAILPVAEGVVK